MNVETVFFLCFWLFIMTAMICVTAIAIFTGGC